MELRHLRYFVTVAEEEHIARAAERLHISASPLSRQIQQLEREIGLQLLARVGRRVRLTDAGRVFLHEVRGLLSRIDDAVRSAQAASRGEVGRLRVAFIDAGRTAWLLSTILQRFRQRHPKITVELTPMSINEQMLALDSGWLDAAVCYRPGLRGSLFEVETLFSEPLHLILPRRHPLARRNRVMARDLVGLPLIWLPRSHAPYYFDSVRSALQERDVELDVHIESWSPTTRLRLVADGMGVTFSVPSAVEKFNGVTARAFSDLSLQVDSALLWRRDNASSLPLKSFREVVLSTAHELRRK